MLDDVWRLSPLDPVPTVALGVVAVWLAVHVALVRTRTTLRLAGVLLCASVLLVLAYTGRGALSNDDGEFVWHLGESIRAELDSVNRSWGLVNVLGNIALFVPVGWFVAVLSVRRPVALGILCALALSAAVEVGQMLSGSFGDVDDLVLNVVGGLLGAGVVAALRTYGSGRTARTAEPEQSGLLA